MNIIIAYLIFKSIRNFLVISASAHWKSFIVQSQLLIILFIIKIILVYSSPCFLRFHLIVLPAFSMLNHYFSWRAYLAFPVVHHLLYSFSDPLSHLMWSLKLFDSLVFCVMILQPWWYVHCSPRCLDYSAFKIAKNYIEWKWILDCWLHWLKLGWKSRVGQPMPSHSLW